MKLCLNILGILSILLIVCLVVVLIESYFENHRLTVTQYQIHDSKLPESFSGFRIVQLSDFHNTVFGSRNQPLFDVIKEQNPDIILITGDMIIGKPNNDVCYAADTINAFCDIAPVYFSMGNHELRVSLYQDTYGDMWQQFKERLSSKVHLLFDERADVEYNNAVIRLYGLNLTPEFYKRVIRTPMSADYLQSLFGKCNQEEYHIFMAHNPDYFPEYANWGANLTFSGHVHGGMIRIPFVGGVLSPMIHFFPKYDKGMFRKADKYMILSGGLGNHTFKFRVNNLPEVVSVTLYKE